MKELSPYKKPIRCSLSSRPSLHSPHLFIVIWIKHYQYGIGEPQRSEPPWPNTLNFSLFTPSSSRPTTKPKLKSSNYFSKTPRPKKSKKSLQSIPPRSRPLKPCGITCSIVQCSTWRFFGTTGRTFKRNIPTTRNSNRQWMSTTGWWTETTSPSSTKKKATFWSL